MSLNDAVLVNGKPYITQTFTYAWCLATKEYLYQIAGALGQGMAVKIGDPSGIKPDIDFQPTDNALTVLKAAGMPITSLDQGVSYEYGWLFTKGFTLDVAFGKVTPTQLETTVVGQMLADGWSTDLLAPWI